MQEGQGAKIKIIQKSKKKNRRDNRDLNASINIKTVGVHAVKQSVMGSTLPPEVKQAIPVELMNFL